MATACAINRHARIWRSSCPRESNVFRNLRQFSSPQDAMSALFSFSNLGLAETLIGPNLETLQQLPEIENALRLWNNEGTTDIIKFAVEIFDSIQPAGGPLALASTALLAECAQQQGRYEEASKSLKSLGKLILPESNDTLYRVGLAHAKVLWYKGNFGESLKVLESSLSLKELDTDLYMACILNAKGIIRFLDPTSSGNANSSIKDLEMGVTLTEQNSLENHARALTSASVKGNLGIVSVISRLGLDESEPQPGTLGEGDLEVFRDGLNLLEQMDDSLPAQHRVLADFIRSQLYCNMSWTLLQQQDELKPASEYASSALSIVEKLKGKLSMQDFHRGLGRSLRLTASCYAKANSAVTAEGLYQSAIDSLESAAKNNPMACLDLRDARDDYASLLHRWDKRTRDAENQDKKRDNVNSSLSEGWRDKSSLCSGLDFVTPGGYALGR